MHRWAVQSNSNVSYTVQLTNAILSDNSLLKDGNVPGRRLLIVDSGVPDRKIREIRSFLTHREIDVHVISVPGGEDCKSAEILFFLLEEFSRYELDRRNEPTIIIGGGAVLDVAALAASLYRRGVPYIRIPTTLLAYVDASVGIKTGINFSSVKNLVGTFHPPLYSILDKSFFKSLSQREISSGLGEIMKLAVACDEPLFNLLEETPTSVFFEDRFQNEGDEILFRAIDSMIAEIEPNLLEDNLIRPVDFGHTFSQAFELTRSKDTQLRHGEAVALDVALSTIMANRRRLLSKYETGRILEVIFDLIPSIKLYPVDFSEIWRSLRERTVHRGGFQHLPLPQKIGSVAFVNDVSAHELEAAVADLAVQCQLRCDADDK
ncbi:sedoheptulose 7-phosphate cyclase [Rhodococcus sp. 1139]|uniref:sedoheptulose 7-phosphate cyclase n=1 Tax=Rhodococcus sp. 1139 TaxID=1833762 RepID=UPI000871E05F|nr:sedoheptulose 7-phosphate cyclase [Rhodococcus sp. 1139]OFE06471.1 hypothetical protein A5N83_23115 [Rhodococcus sp. 1139]